MTYQDPNAIKRFFSKVLMDDGEKCWEWQAHKNRFGYGRFDLRGKDGKWFKRVAHRVAYELFFGDVPDGFELMHKCDNPSCVNPNHLLVGTHSQNMQDCAKKGRNVIFCGENNHNSKLSLGDVMEIRKLWSSGEYSKRELGEKFGVSPTQISNVVLGRQWKGAGL